MAAFTSIHHTFDINLASQHGIEEAILIHHFQHWIRYNKALKRNFHDGRHWTYQTREEIAAHFPYWGPEKVRRYIESLIEKNILIAGNYNKTKFDRTLWYAFNDEELFLNSNNSYERQKCQMEEADPPNPIDENARPIPHTITNTKKDKREREAPPPPTPPPFVFTSKASGKQRVKLTLEQHQKLLAELGENKLMEMMERLDEYADLNPKRFNQYACHATVIRKWFREDKLSSHGGYTSNASWIDKLIILTQGYDQITWGPEGVSFALGQSYEFIKYKDRGAREQIISKLRKMNINVSEFEKL